MTTAFDLFVQRPSWLHSLDSRTKLAFVAAGTILLLIFEHVLVVAAFLLGAHAIIISAGIPGSRIRWAWQRMMPITLLIVLLWPVFYPGGGTVLFQVWRIRVTSLALIQGLATALRVDALAFIFLVLLFSTDQSQLVRGLVKLKLPYEWGLTLAIALRYLPTIYGLYVMVLEAQQARGWVVGEGGFRRRLKSYMPVLVAVIIAALRMADNLSFALAARGFGSGGTRTHLRDVQFGPLDGFCLAILAVMFAVLTVVRFGYGFGARPW